MSPWMPLRRLSCKCPRPPDLRRILALIRHITSYYVVTCVAGVDVCIVVSHIDCTNEVRQFRPAIDAVNTMQAMEGSRCSILRT